MIHSNNISTYALKPQKKVGVFDYPFTLNPFIGCEMQCSYCFVPGPVIKSTRNKFFTDVQVKVNILDLLKKELKKYSSLPQHLKRVQIGVTTELFQPKVINYMKASLCFDLIEEILKIFKEEWNNGNKWMLHILTKNHNILSYLTILKSMKEMVHIEFSIIHHDEIITRKFEKYTSSVAKRIDAIQKLSNEGIFVRVMAMPFYGDAVDLQTLQTLVVAAGAKAFKNKALNYYEWSQLNNINALDSLSRTKTKTNSFIPSLLVKSGEEVLPKSVSKVLLPKIRKRGEKFINWSINQNGGLDLQDVPDVDMGYTVTNNVSWGYLK